MAIQSRPPAFLLTRPAVQSQRFAAELRRNFGDSISVLTSPMLEPEFPIAPPKKGSYHAVIFTSETGVAAYARQPGQFLFASKTAYCVGDRTAKAARSAGFEPVSANGDAEALIKVIHAQLPKGPLLHLCAEVTRGDIAARLTQAGITTSSCVVYRQVERPLSAAACQLLQGESPVVVPLFSPRSSVLFSTEASRLQATAPLVCTVLSDAVAEPLRILKNTTVVCAASPTSESMVEAMASFFDAQHTP